MSLGTTRLLFDSSAGRKTGRGVCVAFQTDCLSLPFSAFVSPRRFILPRMRETAMHERVIHLVESDWRASAQKLLDQRVASGEGEVSRRVFPFVSSLHYALSD